ncbi:MAG: polysaccharide deacetylase family protein, partial [Alphaproteobacteria bacterium]|nr:polysaccharide deacetylase family protein [Alphaproteobacteria bacterium]
MRGRLHRDPAPDRLILRSHGRYPFSALPDRAVWEWPNGARLAAYVAVNLEAFPFAEGLGVPLANPLPEPDIVNFGWRDWGNRVGVWYLLDTLDAAHIPATALMNTAILDVAPRVAQAFLDRGDEFVAHGRSNAERQSDMDEACERAMILECRARLASFTGTAPRGWMGPWVAETHATPNLLAEAGFDYVMDWPHDDQPTWLATRAGQLLALPYARPLNDLPALHGARQEPRDWADALLETLNCLPEHLWPKPRRRKEYLNSVLARAEIGSTYQPARKLWQRLEKGY